MKYFQFATLFLSAFLASSAVQAAEEPEMMNSFVEDSLEAIEIKEMSAEEDDFYTGTDIVPLEKSLSSDETMREDSTDLSVMNNQPPVALNCNDPRLKAQIEHFIYQNINKEETNSVIEKRKRLLLVRNMADFEEVTDEQIDSKTDFETMAALAYMKINKHIDINKICRSTQSQSGKFKNIYAILYVYAGYYKVVVTNLMPVTEKMDEATFIFNWQE